MISTSVSSSSLSWLVAEFIIIFVAVIGGVLVFRGLWIENQADDALKKEHPESFVDGVKSLKLKSKRGWKMLMWGIAIETVVAGVFAARDGWEIRQVRIDAAKNNPLKAPVSDIFAILHLDIKAGTFDPHAGHSPLEHSTMYFSGTNMGFPLPAIFNMSAKEAGSYDHYSGYNQPRTAIYYGIAVKFEPSRIPAFEWDMDINNTNVAADVAAEFASITVTDAISKISFLRAYIDFIPTNTVIIKGNAKIFINGFEKDFDVNSNGIDFQMSQWNPERPGMFLNGTAKIR
jgi:hypothetical protein